MKPNKRVFVYCEGITEYLYAKSLQETLPRSAQRQIKIEYNYDLDNEPATMIKKALSLVKEAKRDKVPYDDVWLFFDNDNRQNLEIVFSRIEKEGFKFSFSSISIEHWFILHFEECGKSFSSPQEAERYLKKLWPEYHKTKVKHYDYLQDKIERAIHHAHKIKKNTDPDIPISRKNTYFTVDELISFFRKLMEASNI